MISNSSNPSIFEYDNQISPADLAQAVGDYQGGPSSSSSVDGSLNLILRVAINSAG